MIRYQPKKISDWRKLVGHKVNLIVDGGIVVTGVITSVYRNRIYVKVGDALSKMYYLKSRKNILGVCLAENQSPDFPVLNPCNSPYDDGEYGVIYCQLEKGHKGDCLDIEYEEYIEEAESYVNPIPV